jgi:DNA processing protein
MITRKAMEHAQKELDFIEKHGIHLYYYKDDNYPYRLAQCADAPLMLYAKGNVDVNPQHVVSVIGTRMPSERGKEWCRQLIHDLAAQVPDLTIVSGLAYGIDVVAHKAAMESGISTIIIPAHGLDRIYPIVHRSVAIEALNRGGILTEYTTGIEPERYNFVARNRIIAGMADALVVVESKSKGGSLITAQMAQDYSRDIFALPGRFNDSNSETHLAT